ncbi:hypothetical protein QU38_02560, partial [Staphylococcus aureus]
MLDAGDSQAGHARAVDRALPAGEFLDGEAIAFANFVDAEQAAVHGRHHLCLAAYDPAGRLRRGKRLERDRTGHRAHRLRRTGPLVLNHLLPFRGG